MPIYPMQTSDGDVVERFYHMREAPEIGAIVEDPEMELGSLTRLPSNHTRPVVCDYNHVAHSLPRVHDPRRVAALRMKEAAKEKDPARKEELLKSADEWSRAKKVWKNVTSEGKPVFTSKADVLEFQARTGQRLGWSQD